MSARNALYPRRLSHRTIGSGYPVASDFEHNSAAEAEQGAIAACCPRMAPGPRKGARDSCLRRAVHTALRHSIKNELAAGVLPCGRFGANAAWLRLSALTHNVLTAMKRLALPAELLRARPKRLRFLVFVQPGRFVRHARQLTLRLMRAWRRFSNWTWAFEQLPLAAPS